MLSKMSKLSELKESEIVFRTLLKRYEQDQILKDINEIDKLIEELIIKKQDIIENRQNVSEIKLNELRQQLKANRLKQEIATGRNSLLTKLAKAIKIIKETEKV